MLNSYNFQIMIENIIKKNKIEYKIRKIEKSWGHRMGFEKPRIKIELLSSYLSSIYRILDEIHQQERPKYCSEVGAQSPPLSGDM